MKQEQFTKAFALPSSRQYLMDTANYIREHGWCQNAVETTDGRVCVWGAIQKVGKPKEDTIMLLYSFLGVDSIGLWNDLPGRTAEEVISAIEAAALS